MPEPSLDEFTPEPEIEPEQQSLPIDAVEPTPAEDDITAALGVTLAAADRRPYRLPSPSILQKSKTTGAKVDHAPVARAAGRGALQLRRGRPPGRNGQRPARDPV